ncbi:MAG TPA: FapA family protein, partial [Spirochaetia bacterium]
LRSKRDVTSAFAEQAVLLAIGDVRLRGPCVRCQVKCNGRLVLESEKGTLVGGEVRASRGIDVQNIGSPAGTRTVVSFGQDFLVKDQIEREEREVAALTRKVADIDAEMVVLEKRMATASATGGAAATQSQEAASLARARAQKLQAMKLIEQRKLRLIGLRDRYDEHVASEIVIRGTLYPGAILESHGRRYETALEKKMITLHFDPKLGKIVEKA